MGAARGSTRRTARAGRTWAAKDNLAAGLRAVGEYEEARKHQTSMLGDGLTMWTTQNSGTPPPPGSDGVAGLNRGLDRRQFWIHVETPADRPRDVFAAYRVVHGVELSARSTGAGGGAAAGVIHERL